MKHFQILKRSWDILWSYKALWVFGIILALTGAAAASGGSHGGGGSGGGGSSFLIGSRQEISQALTEVSHNLSRLAQSTQSAELEPWMIVLIVLGSLLMLVLGVVFTIGHYVSQVALIRMVDRHEGDGTKLTWRQGFRLGWSKAAWRLFLISFMIGLVAFVVFTLLFGLAALPAVLGEMIGDALFAVGIILSVGMGMLVILLAILTALLVSFLLEPVRRICVLEERGVIDALRQGIKLARAHILDVGLMWLLTIGVRIGVGFVLAPVALLLVMLALLLGGGLGGLIYLLTSTLAAGWVYAVVVGGLVFFILLGVPLTFAGGMLQTYLSTTWTLTYRALKAA